MIHSGVPCSTAAKTSMARLCDGFTGMLCFVALFCCAAIDGQLSATFYGTTCPNLQSIVRSGMSQAVNRERRVGASMLRLFFHDCFVNGCDASVLLDDTPTITGEKNARPNANSLHGFEVVDTIKSAVEAACPTTVSCADILSLAARDSVVLLGGPTWTVTLGRRDATTASQSAANANLPSTTSSLSQLIATFAGKGLSARDMTALSGAHTVGLAYCANYRAHIYNDSNIDPGFASLRRQNCPLTPGDGDGAAAPLDAQTPMAFDNAYFRDLMAQRSLLHTDQELFNGGSQDALVQQYSANAAAFFTDFAAAMERMGNISPLTGSQGEIRINCRRVNGYD
ncbi:hypothetical protein ZIOFF_000619 [Zingiber officinale]|uniref:Peroxidase n=1 Tax=Zingiber officinale TaxID=94328 RepID=A0A8J5HU98_ZINOF|nr:hypothetical protein ZIOFF_000619 [Zingiber officinale]